MWLLGGLSLPGPCHQHHQVLISTTITLVGAPLGLVPDMLVGSLCLLLYSLGAATKSPALRGHRAAGVAVTWCHHSWGC